MKLRTLLFLAAAAGLTLLAVEAPVIHRKTGDRTRPQPPKVTPASTPGGPPSDAVVLFSGDDLSAWQQRDGSPAKWQVHDGYFQVTPESGDLVTKQPFGDAQIHVEWATPSPTKGSDQDPGNSGVYLMSLYEVQVLDNYENKTYPDGQAAAIYCQYPPLVNACKPPGEWQTYDIIFHGARFTANGELRRTATVTVLHNGVLAQDNVAPTGPTDYMKRPPYKKGPDKAPLLLQDHGQPVRYRNIWIRELDKYESQ